MGKEQILVPALLGSFGETSARLLSLLEDQRSSRGFSPEVLESLKNTPPERADWFSVLEWLVPRRGELPPEQEREIFAQTELLLRHQAYGYPPPGRDGGVEPVVFGTGGHRGQIGRGLTMLHVHVIITALINTIADLPPADRELHFGSPDISEIRRKGFVLGHDNRLFNPEFSFYAAHLLRQAGYEVRYAGRVTSPQLSLLVPHRGWAGALNFTPSHNPFRYGGIKLNPCDGGLAGSELTDPLAMEANRLLQGLGPGDWPGSQKLWADISRAEKQTQPVELNEPYLDLLAENPVIRLNDMAREIAALQPPESLVFVVDPVWGAAVPVYRALQRRLGENTLQLLHTEDDPYFGGQTTEPNEQTLGDVMQALRQSSAAFKVGIRNDPDSDRGLVGDDRRAVKMNKYAAMVMRYLMDLGQTGDMVTTLPTSHFGPDYARSRGCEVVLTPTGFKNFRPHMKNGQGLLSYEESDGLSIRGHTLDKDGVLAGLLAVRMVLHYRRSLSALLEQMEGEMGEYHWLQETFFIEMSAAEARTRLRRLEDIRPGTSLEAGGKTRTITAINTEDGYKFSLDDGTWLMMRPSGTEPKLRIYAETRESEAASAALCEAGREMARRALEQ
ncbi:MAG: hypothetical protein OEZ59_01460 [Deltaproteobacteria bacterium]|nr:hypothetical protein [Deltaproteobacteria bacterium]